MLHCVAMVQGSAVDSSGGTLFGEKTHTTGLRELCPGISLVPRLHNGPGNEASPGVCDRYVPE